MNLAELDALFSEMERVPGTLRRLDATDDRAVGQLAEDLRVTLPPEYVEFFSQYSVLDWGPNELLGPNRCGRLLETMLEGSTPPRHWIPIMEDGAGGFYYIVAAPRGKMEPANFGAVMYIAWDERQGQRKLSKSLYYFLAQRCCDWLDERAAEAAAEEFEEPQLPNSPEKRESIDEILARLELVGRGWRATLPQRFTNSPGESIDLVIITRSEDDSGPPLQAVTSEKKLARLILAAWLDVSRLAWSACAQHHIAQQNHNSYTQAMSREIVIDRDMLSFEGPERWKFVYRLGNTATEVCFDGVTVREVRTVRFDS